MVNPDFSGQDVSSRNRRKHMLAFRNKCMEQWEKGGIHRDSLVRLVLKSAREKMEKHDNSGCHISTEEANLRRCERLAREDGQLLKAVQALSSCGIAAAGPETTEQLIAKHPQNIELPLRPISISASETIQINQNDVLLAILSRSKKQPHRDGLVLCARTILIHLLRATQIF
jgi:hypothetical protein